MSGPLAMLLGGHERTPGMEEHSVGVAHERDVPARDDHAALAPHLEIKVAEREGDPAHSSEVADERALISM